MGGLSVVYFRALRMFTAAKRSRESRKSGCTSGEEKIEGKIGGHPHSQNLFIDQLPGAGVDFYLAFVNELL